MGPFFSTNKSFRPKKVLTKISICVSMCENLGIQSNLSQARNHDWCEHKIWLSLLSFDSRGLKITSRMNLESGPQFAEVWFIRKFPSSQIISITFLCGYYFEVPCFYYYCTNISSDLRSIYQLLNNGTLHSPLLLTKSCKTACTFTYPNMPIV